MARLIFMDQDKISEEHEVLEGESVKQHCEDAGVPFACEEGCCGTCVIEVVEGMENLSDPTQEELDFLGDMDCERLACQCRMKCGTVKIKF